MLKYEKGIKRDNPRLNTWFTRGFMDLSTGGKKTGFGLEAIAAGEILLHGVGGV